MYSDWPSKARLPVMESVIVKGLTGLETECPTLCQLFKSSACVRAINQMSRVSNGIYSSEGTIIVPHQIIVRYEYSAMFSKGPPPLWLLLAGNWKNIYS